MISSSLTGVRVPAEENQCSTMMLPPPCFTVSLGFCGSLTCLLESGPKTFIFYHVVWGDFMNLSVSIRWLVLFLFLHPDIKSMRISVTYRRWLVFTGYSCSSFNVAAGPSAASQTLSSLSFHRFCTVVLFLVMSVQCSIFFTSLFTFRSCPTPDRHLSTERSRTCFKPFGVCSQIKPRKREEKCIVTAALYLGLIRMA